MTFSMAFTMHPLVGGEIVSGTPTPDPSSPITETSTGTTVTFTLTTAGQYGFYCGSHGVFGMKGALFVE